MIVVHWVRPCSNGPIRSTGGPQLPAELHAELQQTTVGTPGAYAVACKPSIQLGAVNMGTDQTYLVTCPKCRSLPAFREAWKHHPSRPDDRQEPETEPTSEFQTPSETPPEEPCPCQ